MYWNEIPTTNILKEIKNNINKLSTNTNILCRSDIVTTRSRMVRHQPHTCRYI